MKNFDDCIKNLNIEIKQNESLSLHTTIKIGGKTKYFITVFDAKSLKKLIFFCKKYSKRFLIIGNGSNILFSDNGFNGIVIKLVGEFLDIIKSNNNIICGAGVNLFALNTFLLKNSLTGMEWSYGIPASIGGATLMNAGAYDGEMSKMIVWVKVLLSNGKIKTFNKKQCKFSYRYSIFKDINCIILSIKLKLKKSLQSKIKNLMQTHLDSRKNSQPYGTPSAGSVFLREDNVIPAKMIDKLSLKGFSIGDAQISQIHSGFIINLGSATCQQVLDLIKYIQSKVFSTYNILIKLEIIIIKE